MTARLTDADLAEIARLHEVAQPPEQQPHAGMCYCHACNSVRTRRWAALDAREALLGSDAIGRLLAELSATRRERDEAYRTADQLREGVRGLEADRDRALALAESLTDIATTSMSLQDKAERRAAEIEAEQQVDRAAAVALVGALPRCDEPGCLAHATCGYASEEVVSAVRFCDAHREDGCVDRPEAEELRALLDRMATWGEAQADGPASAVSAEDIAAHERDVDVVRIALHAGPLPRDVINWPAFWERRKRLGAAAESIEAPVRATVEWMMQECGEEESDG